MIRHDMKETYNRTKWALVLRGLFSIAVGVFIIWRPLSSIAALALIIAFWALVDGIVNCVRAFTLRPVAPHWWVLLLAGVVSIAFGIAAFYYYPSLSLAFAVVWAGLWLITGGMIGASVALQERSLGLAWGWTMTLSVIVVAGGVVALAYPGITLTALMAMLASIGIVTGIVLLVGAGRMQSIERDFEHLARAPAGMAR